jgi:predicted nuclease of predicted toxin-antitoxin system
MKFLLDAQLPPTLKQVFIDKGYDCIHTMDLELGNNTPDKEINAVSTREQRVLITKDSDFYDSIVIRNEPYKLILVKLGNTSRKELIQFFHDRFDEIIEKIKEENMILLSKES